MAMLMRAELPIDKSGGTIWVTRNDIPGKDLAAVIVLTLIGLAATFGFVIAFSI
jgi:hypothetical protein